MLISDVAAGSVIAHYNPLMHCLEPIAEISSMPSSVSGFGIILSNIYWREAWKYGERAFRYCNHDVGHALGALGYSAKLHNWKFSLKPWASSQQLNRLTGFDTFEIPKEEFEGADCLCRVSLDDVDDQILKDEFNRVSTNTLEVNPNQLSAEHMDWSVIYDAARLSHSPGYKGDFPKRQTLEYKSRAVEKDLSAEQVIRQRRSA